MTSRKRFLLGGGGALMPVMVSLLAIDIGAALDSDANLTTGNIIGVSIRYLILFIVGGIVAYLHEDEHKPFKLFELGIAAPALITSLITAQGVVANTKPPELSSSSFNLSIISSAYAETGLDETKEITVAWRLRLNEVLDGVSGKAYRKVAKPRDKAIDKTSTDNEIGKHIEESKSDNSEMNLRKAKAEAARANAKAEIEKARSAQLQAELARAKADALEKAYEAGLAQSKAAEAKALAAEQDDILLERGRN